VLQSRSSALILRFCGLGLVLSLSAGSWTPVHAVSLPPLRASQPPLFTADVAISLDSDGKPALSIAFSVPNSELQWVKVPRGYAAGAELAVVFEPVKPGRIYGDVWERRMVVASFPVTNSASATLTEKRSFDVPPGRYNVRVSLRDVNAGQQSQARERIDVPDYSRVPIGFADLDLGLVDTLGNFTSVPTRLYGFNVSRLAARASMFDRRPGSWPRQYTFRYRILNDLGEELTTGTQGVSLARSADPVIVRPANSELFIGGYDFEVTLVEDKSRWRVDRTFEVEESGPPRGKEFEQMLEALSYIADAREIDHLRSLGTEDQARGWEEFWRRRDPTPETVRNEAMLEFFRRVRYTERHFQGFGPGWRSDMGRIYIKFGPPDQIESHPSSADTPSYEMWFYNQPYRRFVFADREGFGRFVLVSPSLE
jgi:GWxTD domain-containing protein